MTTYHVGGLIPIHRYQSFADALEKAQNGDTIQLHKSIKETVTIKKTVIIQGNNKTITALNGKVAITAEAPIHLQAVNFQVESHANALVLHKGGHLQNINIQLKGPLIAIYPAIYLIDGNLTIRSSRITKLFAESETSNLTLDDVAFSSYYPDHIQTQSRAEQSMVNGRVVAKNSTLMHVYINDVKAYHCQLGPYFDLNNALLTACQFNLPEPTTEKPSRKEPPAGPLESLTNFPYLVGIHGNATINQGYKVPETIPNNWCGFYVDKAVLKLNQVRLKQTRITHQVYHSSISFDQSYDANRWELISSTPSLVKSKVNTSTQVRSAMELLDELIGLEDVKSFIKGMMVDVQFAKKTEHNFGASYHMIFAGNPGSAKTTVARLVAQALFEAGVLPENKLVEASADTLIKGYVGQTGENVQKILDSALGGVLFIDEAYQLASKDGQNSFNEDVLGPLLRYMEDYRDQLVVIAAGYPREMKDFVASNPGLSRRFNWVDFKDYSLEELAAIFELIRTQHKDHYVDDYQPDLVGHFDQLTHIYLTHPDAKGRITNGGNGGLSRNVYQAVVSHRNRRVVDRGINDFSITPEDIEAGFAAELEKADRMLSFS